MLQEKQESMTHTSEVYEFVRRNECAARTSRHTPCQDRNLCAEFQKLVVPLQMLLDASRARDEMKTEDVVRVRSCFRVSVQC